MRNAGIKNYTLPPVDGKEVWRYAGMKGSYPEGEGLLSECISLVKNLSGRVVYRELSKEELFSLLPSTKRSQGLVTALAEAERTVVFAATVGIEMDRLVARYARISPARALILQAIGAERVESLCDIFCKDKKIGRRYSPGYGDLSPEAQTELFRLLPCDTIGLTLTDSRMMTPTKSVTAIGAVGDFCERACAGCDKKDCVVRR